MGLKIVMGKGNKMTDVITHLNSGGGIVHTSGSIHSVFKLNRIIGDQYALIDISGQKKVMTKLNCNVWALITDNELNFLDVHSKQVQLLSSKIENKFSRISETFKETDMVYIESLKEQPEMKDEIYRLVKRINSYIELYAGRNITKLAILDLIDDTDMTTSTECQ